MATLEELSAALVKADAAGNTADAQAFADAIRQMRGVSVPTAKTGADAIPGQRYKAPPAEPDRDLTTGQKIYRKAKEFLSPTFEALATTGGGIAGTALGPVGSALGSGLGYGAAKEVERLGDIYLGGTTPEQAQTQPVQNVMEGAVGDLAGRVIAAPVIDKAAKAAGWVWDAVGGRLVQVRAGKIIRQIAGADLDAIKTAAANAPQNLTAAQATQQVGNNVLAALGEKAAKNDVTNYFTRLAAEQEAARQAALRGVTPDLAAAMQTRAAGVEPFYTASDKAMLPGRTRQFAPVKTGTVSGGSPAIDPLTGQPIMVPAQPSTTVVPATSRTATTRVEIGRDSFNQPIYADRPVQVTTPRTVTVTTGDTLTNTPALTQDVTVGGAPTFKQVLSGYEYDPQLAKLMERPGIKSAFASAQEMANNRGVALFTPDGKLTGQGAHLVKIAIDDAITPAAKTPLAKNAADALKSAKSAYLDWVETNVPAYKQGRETFAALSVPVNQAQLLGEMQSVLAKPGGGERVTPFLNALGRGENALIKRAGGEPRFGGIEEVLSPQQMGVVNDIASQFNRDLQLAQSAAAGKGGLSRILGETKSNAELPPSINLFTRSMNKILSVVEGSVNKNTLAALEKGMRSGKDLVALLDTLPVAERNATLKAISTISPTTGRTLGAGVNALSSQQNQNALAR